MTTTVRKVVLPRRSLTGDARSVSRAIKLVRTAPKAEPEPELEDPLAGWHPGFARKAAIDHLEDLGGSLPQRPDTDPDMPDDVTDLPSDALGTLHAQFVAYTEWMETEVALAEIDSAEADAYLEHVDAEIRLKKAGTVKDKDAKTKNDLRFINTEQAKIIAEAKAKLLKARTKGYERCASALSREMTRRVPTE